MLAARGVVVRTAARFGLRSTTGLASLSTTSAASFPAAAAAAIPELPSNLSLDFHALGLLREAAAENAAAASSAEEPLLPTAVPIYAVTAQDAAADSAVAAAGVKPTGSSAELSPAVWHQPVRQDLVHRVLVWQQKNARTTLYKTKDRAETRGGGKKPWRQKGTGRARASSIRSPLWKGGGVSHGPVFRDWSISLPKRIRALGLRVALSSKLRDGRLVVVESLPDFAVVGSDAEDISTLTVKARDIKGFVSGVLDSVQGYAPPRSLPEPSADGEAAADAEAEGIVQQRRERHGAQNAQPSVLVVDVDVPAPLFKGCANLQRVKVLPVKALNVQDVAWAQTVVLTKQSLQLINAALAPELDRSRDYDAIAEQVLA